MARKKSRFRRKLRVAKRRATRAVKATGIPPSVIALGAGAAVATLLYVLYRRTAGAQAASAGGVLPGEMLDASGAPIQGGSAGTSGAQPAALDCTKLRGTLSPLGDKYECPPGYELYPCNYKGKGKYDLKKQCGSCVRVGCAELARNQIDAPKGKGRKK